MNSAHGRAAPHLQVMALAVRTHRRDLCRHPPTIHSHCSLAVLICHNEMAACRADISGTDVLWTNPLCCPSELWTLMWT